MDKRRWFCWRRPEGEHDVFFKAVDEHDAQNVVVFRLTRPGPGCLSFAAAVPFARALGPAELFEVDEGAWLLDEPPEGRPAHALP